MQRAGWLWRIARTSEDKWVKRVLRVGEGGKRRRGKLQRKWLSETIADLRTVN